MFLAPDVLKARWNEALAHFNAGRLAAAEAALAPLAPSFAGNAEYFRVRGLTARGLGESGRALECFRAAVQLAPDRADHRFNLADELARQSADAEAIDEFRAAVACHGRPSQGWLMLAELLDRGGRREEALSELARLADAGRDDPETLKAVALHAERWGGTTLAERAVARLRALRPADLDAKALHHKLIGPHVQAWHFPMMNDAERNAAYDRAIRRAVRPGLQVLEIGTGAGLLALMAARAGAARVTTCEMVPAIAEAAAEIVQRNGVADRVRVIAKVSTELRVGADLPERADLLVSEILSSDLVTENVVAAVADAKARLLKPGAPMIPCAVSAVARLVGGEDLVAAMNVGTVDGFDLSPFNRFAPGAIAVRFSDQSFDSLSEDVEILRFDLAAGAAPPREQDVALAATRPGMCAGLLQWIRLHLDAETVFENRPAARFAASGWKLMFYPFPLPRRVAAGETVRVRAGYSVGGLAFVPLD